MAPDVVGGEICDASADFMSYSWGNLWLHAQFVYDRWGMEVCGGEICAEMTQQKQTDSREILLDLFRRRLTTKPCCPTHETSVLRSNKSSLCQQWYPHSPSTATHEHLTHLSYRVWASRGTVPDLKKYLPFWSWVNSAVPSFFRKRRVLLRLRR